MAEENQVKQKCRMRSFHLMASMVLLALTITSPADAASADPGLITKPSNYSVQQTIERFEAAVKAQGWMVFTELDHAAAAAKYGLTMRPRTVIVYGNPPSGTPVMQKAPTLAIDDPPKALVWEDDQGKVWLTYNSAEYFGNYVYPRHGVTMSDDQRHRLEQFLDRVSDQATK